MFFINFLFGTAASRHYRLKTFLKVSSNIFLPFLVIEKLCLVHLWGWLLNLWIRAKESKIEPYLAKISQGTKRTLEKMSSALQINKPWLWGKFHIQQLNSKVQNIQIWYLWQIVSQFSLLWTYTLIFIEFHASSSIHVMLWSFYFFPSCIR